MRRAKTKSKPATRGARAAKPAASALAAQTATIERLALEVEASIQETVRGLRVALLPNPFEEIGQ